MTKSRRWGLVAGFLLGGIASGLVAFLAVIALMRECGYPPSFVRPVYAVIALVLVIGAWFVSGARRRWATALAFATLLVPPLVAVVLASMCSLAWVR